MTPLLKSLLGNGSNDRQLTEEMRAVLNEIRQGEDDLPAAVRSIGHPGPPRRWPLNSELRAAQLHR